MSSLQSVNIDDNTRNLLKGYIRSTEKSMDKMIPDEIMFIILSFYYLNEFFKDVCSECSLTENKTNIKVIAGCNKNAYGYIHIDSMNDNGVSHHWKFRLGSMEIDGETSIGIVQCDVMKFHGLYMAEGRGYGYCGEGYKMVPLQDDADYDMIIEKARFKPDDIVEMVLNLKKRSLLFMINNEESVSIDNIKVGENIKYKMAVFLGCCGDWIQLMTCYAMKY